MPQANRIVDRLQDLADVNTSGATDGQALTKQGTTWLPSSVVSSSALWVSVKDAAYGATGNGTTDDAAAVQAALDAVNTAGGGTVYLPAGTYLVGTTLVLYSKVTMRGAGIDATTIKLKNGTNADLIRTYQFSTFTGTAPANPLAPYHFALRDLTLDGNKANNTSGWPLRIYGRAYRVCNIEVVNGASGGAWTEWGTGGGDMESRWQDFSIRDCTDVGLDYRGPHDSLFINGVIARAGTTGIQTSAPSSAGQIGGEMFSNCHVYGSQATGWSLGGHHYLINCQGEGSTGANLLLLANKVLVMGGAFFGTNGANPNEVGIEIGGASAVAGCHIETELFNWGAGGFPIKYTNDGGYHIIRCTVDQGAATSLTTGTAQNTSQVDLLCRDVPASSLMRIGVRALTFRPGFLQGSQSTGTEFNLGRAAIEGRLVVPNVNALYSSHALAGDLVIRQDVNTAQIILQSGAAGAALRVSADGSDNPKLGFYGTAPATKPTVSGARGGNAALANILSRLAALGIITDSTTAAADPNDATRLQNGMWCAPNIGYFFSTIVAAASAYRLARFVPTRNMTIVKIGFVVTTAATADDAVDVGLFSASGARLVSSGATTGKVNSTGAKTITVTSTPLTAGTVYYAGLAYGAVGGTAATLITLACAAAAQTTMFGATAGTAETSSQVGATLPDPGTVGGNTNSAFALAVLES